MCELFFKKSGFTLIEVILVILILGIVISVGGTLMGFGFKGGFASKDSIYAASIARVSIERMSFDLLSARNATTTDLTPNANSITFVTTDDATVSYSLSGTNLMRNTKILANYVTALNFTYLDQVFATTVIATNVRCVVINMTVNYNSNIINLTSTVCPRNYAI